MVKTLLRLPSSCGSENISEDLFKRASDSNLSASSYFSSYDQKRVKLCVLFYILAKP